MLLLRRMVVWLTKDLLKENDRNDGVSLLKPRQIQLKVIHGTTTTVKRQLNNVNKLHLNLKNLQIPTT